MARLQLALPERFHYRTDIQVRITDINYGGHLDNSAVVAILHEVRVRFLSSLGYSEMNVAGAGIIMSDVAVVYKAEGFYADTLIAELAVTDFSRLGCDFLYLLTRTTDGKEIARAKTGIVFFNYETRRPMPVPDAFKTLFGT